MAAVTIPKLAARLAQRHKFSVKYMKALLEELVVEINESLEEGDPVRIQGLGIFRLKVSAPRTATVPVEFGNPTGPKRQVQVPAKRKLTFRPFKR